MEIFSIQKFAGAKLPDRTGCFPGAAIRTGGSGKPIPVTYGEVPWTANAGCAAAFPAERSY